VVHYDFILMGLILASQSAIAEYYVRQGIGADSMPGLGVYLTLGIPHFVLDRKLFGEPVDSCSPKIKEVS